MPWKKQMVTKYQNSHWEASTNSVSYFLNGENEVCKDKSLYNELFL